MTNNPAPVPGRILLPVTSLLLLAKNLYFFYDGYNSIGTWGLGRSFRWVWEPAYLFGAPAIGFIGLCCALVLLIRQKNRQAFYFIAVSVLLFPLHSILLPLFGKEDYFILPYPGSRFSMSVWEMLLLSKELMHYTWLLYLLLTVGGLFVIRQAKVPGVIYYRVLLVLITATIVCSFIPVHDADKMTPLVPAKFKALFYGGIAAWFTALMNYLCNGTRTVLQQIVFCIALVAAIAGCFIIYNEVIPAFTVQATIFFVLSIVSAVLALSFYYIYPYSIIPALFSLMSFVFACIVLFIDLRTGILRDYIPGFILRPDGRDIWQPALIFLTPMLAAPFFREKRTAH